MARAASENEDVLGVLMAPVQKIPASTQQEAARLTQTEEFRSNGELGEPRSDVNVQTSALPAHGAADASITTPADSRDDEQERPEIDVLATARPVQSQAPVSITEESTLTLHLGPLKLFCQGKVGSYFC